MRSTCRTLLMAITSVVWAVAGQVVQAAEPSAASGFYIDLGLAGLLFDTNASIKAAGNPLHWIKSACFQQCHLGLGIGYFVTPNVSLLAVLGRATYNNGDRCGRLSAAYAGQGHRPPSMLVANYHFRQFGAFQPFLGTGMTYTVVFGTQDNAIVNLRVNNSIGAVIRTGFDVMISDRWSAFLSVSKVFVSTNASGNAAISPLERRSSKRPCQFQSVGPVLRYNLPVLISRMAVRFAVNCPAHGSSGRWGPNLNAVPASFVASHKAVP